MIHWLTDECIKGNITYDAAFVCGDTFRHGHFYSEIPLEFGHQLYTGTEWTKSRMAVEPTCPSCALVRFAQKLKEREDKDANISLAVKRKP